MRTINVQAAKTHLSRLVDQAAAGESIVIGKHGKPLAVLTRYEPGGVPRRLGGMGGRITLAPDFDAEDPRINAMFGAGS